MHFKYVAAHNTNEASISACAAGYTDFRILPTPDWSNDLEQKRIYAVGSPYEPVACVTCDSTSDIYILLGKPVCVECLNEMEIKP